MIRRSTSWCLGAGLLVGAGALAVTAMIVGGSGPTATTFVSPATAATPPSTMPTLPPAPTTVPPTLPPVPATEQTLPLSPFADQLPPRISAIPTVETFVAPTEIRIGDLSLRAPINDVGVAPDGQLEIPDETEVGWYRLGSSPGQPGSTVLAAHVTWNDTVGPFFKLAQLEPGAAIELTLADGSVRTYEVIERAQYGKLELPQERIWTRDGDETLVLITCGGDFNRQVRRFADNIVIYAVPVGKSG